MSVEFRDFRRIVLQKIHEQGETFLEEAGGVMEGQAKKIQRLTQGKQKEAGHTLLILKKWKLQ